MFKHMCNSGVMKCVPSELNFRQPATSSRVVYLLFRICYVASRDNYAHTSAHPNQGPSNDFSDNQYNPPSELVQR
jgi:hypothetical protein